MSKQKYDYDDNYNYCELVRKYSERQSNIEVPVDRTNVRPIINQFLDEEEMGGVLGIAMKRCGDDGLNALMDRTLLIHTLRDIYKFSQSNSFFDTHGLINVIGFCGFLIQGFKLPITVDDRLIRQVLSDEEVTPW